MPISRKCTIFSLSRGRARRRALYVVPLELGAGVARRRAEYDESFMAQVCQPAKSRCLVSFSMAVFAKCRLEGRALEHAFSGDKGFGIHMCSSTGVWSWVRGDVAKQITLAMRRRVAELRSDFEAQGLFVQAADSRVRVDEENHSVDLRVYIADKQADALVELKWSRRSLDTALSNAKKSWPWMRKACQSGRWVLKTGKLGKRLKASAVGAIAVGPCSWKGAMQSCSGHWSMSLPSQRLVRSRQTVAAARSGAPGASNWKPWRGHAAPGDKVWWPSGQSGVRKRPASVH